MTLKDKQIILLLNDEWEKLSKAMDNFYASLKKCEHIGIKEIYTLDETDAFDALSSKFARNSDILFQKIFKSIAALLKESAPSFMDRIYLMEKLNIISNAEMAAEIREFRNQIAHEYFMDQIVSIYPKLLKYSNELNKIYKETELFLKHKNWINLNN